MKLFSAQKFQKGFTLIELLVVIGILGILAAALVATIDPFEQLKKADDANIKNMVVEFQTANVRYYTTHSAFPWNDMDASNSNANCQGVSTGGTSDLSALTIGAGNMLSNCIGTTSISNSLIGDGELKAGFSTNTNNLNRIFVTWDHLNPSSMIVCYSPKSKSQKAAPDTKYGNSGGAPAGGATCPNANAADNVCYWCTQ